ncbi:hypothetical protein QFX18_13475 [Saccharophagus degradans]|uniref:hypothetical protein n=1 Tax=Saccharophagus degradans TaxID=86304 RepID=UPI0024781918|nr:hypothetical protein [Saccharophagus degradans]WGO97054.1 hypothetical protein QFX18_13475 [Saccharophagus degradans]
MTGLKLRMREELEQHYTKLRLDALNSANKVFDDPSVQLKLVNNATYAAFAQWNTQPNRIKDWDWPTTLQEWKLKFPKRFEAAAWKSNKLAGLALGRPTYAGSGLRLDYIEKAPITDIRLVETMLVALSAYATLLGANHIRIMHPVNTSVRDYYLSFGFTYNSGQDCCIKRL